MTDDKENNRSEASEVQRMPRWNDKPLPPTGWKESDFCRTYIFIDGEVLFQYKNETNDNPELTDFVLEIDGSLERIDVIATEFELRHRIEAIKKQGGDPDLSIKALEQFLNQDRIASLEI